LKHWKINKEGAMVFKVFITPGLSINTYLIADEKTRECVVVDPPRIVAPIVSYIETENLKLTKVLETHVHADFVSGSKQLKLAFDQNPEIICSATGGKVWIPKYADKTVQDGDSFCVGSYCLKAVATPGHTPEHIAWLVQKGGEDLALLSGDFLFSGDVGRPDLLGEKQKEQLAHHLYHSVFEGLKKFPDALEVFAAHGAGSLCGKAIGKQLSTTVGKERRTNPSLVFKPQKEWIETLLQQMPEAPPYFARMKTMNVEGPEVLGDPLPGFVELDEKEVDPNAFILDVRSQESFHAGHMPGALSIAPSPNLPFWAGWLVPYDMPVVLVVETKQQAKEALEKLLLVGFDTILGFMMNPKGAQEKSKTVKAQELLERLKASHPPLVVDVRSAAEFESGHIQNAKHIPLGILPKHLKDLPKNQEVVTVCQSGYRSNIAASLLVKNGISARSLMGGMAKFNHL
jgi:hydroxyacylglutathione hydrolase